MAMRMVNALEIPPLFGPAPRSVQAEVWWVVNSLCAVDACRGFPHTLSRGGEMIDVENLVYEYPSTRALDGVTLSVRPHTITALVGPNGAGKTTLLRCLAALDTPYSGTVRIAGLHTREAPRA